MGRVGMRFVEHDSKRREHRLWSNLQVQPGDDVVLQAENASAVDRSKPYWTVAMGQLGPGNPTFGPPTKVQVKVAYFAGSQTGG